MFPNEKLRVLAYMCFVSALEMNVSPCVFQACICQAKVDGVGLGLFWYIIQSADQPGMDPMESADQLAMTHVILPAFWPCFCFFSFFFCG